LPPGTPSAPKVYKSKDLALRKPGLKYKYSLPHGYLDIKSLSSMLVIYKLDKYGYPDSEQGLKVLVGQYLKTLPKDPWGKEYLYLSPGLRNAKSFDLYTLGADGAPGGNDENKDIGNWD
jgi:general secretion pathway protein G